MKGQMLSVWLQDPHYSSIVAAGEVDTVLPVTNDEAKQALNQRFDAQKKWPLESGILPYQLPQRRCTQLPRTSHRLQSTGNPLCLPTPTIFPHKQCLDTYKRRPLSRHTGMLLMRAWGPDLRGACELGCSATFCWFSEQAPHAGKPTCAGCPSRPLMRAARPLKQAQCLGVVVDVVLNEGTDEVVGMVVAVLHADGSRVPRSLAGFLQGSRSELVRQEAISRALVYQERQM
mmetsp:Transcript_807/g.2014  ORF Transcript_807/g.2014 Transcript_807/m.2014 type:complete len:231 (+) Transcript_807:195-887(+)